MDKKIDIIALINKIEAEFPVDKWIINGMHIWPIMRFDLYFRLLPYKYKDSLQDKKKNREVTYFLHNPLRIIKTVFGFIRACIDNYRKDKVSAEIIFLSDGFSYSWLKNVWYENYCDPFADYFRRMGKHSLLITPTYRYFVPSYSRTSFILPQLFFTVYIKGIFSKGVVFDKEFLSDFQRLNGFLEEQDLGFASFSLGRIKKKIKHVRDSSRLYKDIFKKVKPRLGLMVEYYRLQGLAFSIACRDSGIPCVDIQHGFKVESHVAYGHWDKVPEGGYGLVPGIFWCWSESEVSLIKKTSKELSRWHRPMLGGNLLFEIWKEAEADFVKYYDNEIAKIKKVHKDFLQILFTLNGETDSELRTLLSLVRRSRGLGLNYYYWIRLHPCRLNDKKKIKSALDKLNIPAVEFTRATDFSLYALLRNMDLHITEFSSTVIEARAFGVPSVIVHNLGASIFKDQIISGWSLAAYDTDDIISAIETQHKRKEAFALANPANQDMGNKGIEALLNYIKINSR